MALDRLPQEINTIIVESLSTQTTLQFMQACRAFYYSALPCLYRCPILDGISSQYSFDDALSSHPGLALLVRSVTLVYADPRQIHITARTRSWFPGHPRPLANLTSGSQLLNCRAINILHKSGPARSEDQLNFRYVLDFVRSSCPNVEILRVGPVIEAGSLDEPSFPHQLAELDLWMPDSTSTSEVQTLFSALPSIVRRVSVFWNRPRDRGFSHHSSRLENVQWLALGLMSEDEFASVPSRFPHLQSSIHNGNLSLVGHSRRTTLLQSLPCLTGMSERTHSQDFAHSSYDRDPKTVRLRSRCGASWKNLIFVRSVNREALSLTSNISGHIGTLDCGVWWVSRPADDGYG
jgi:hypothetical protein